MVIKSPSNVEVSETTSVRIIVLIIVIKVQAVTKMVRETTILSSLPPSP